MSARVPALLLAAAVVVAGVAGAPLSASATGYTVTSSADTGAGTLRAALGSAVSGDVITFAPSVTSIAVASTLFIGSGVTIDGPGSGLLELTRAVSGDFDMLYYLPFAGPGNLSIDGLTLTGRADGTGAAILVVSNANTGAVTLTDVTVRNQTDTQTPAVKIDAATSVTISDSVFYDNVATDFQGGAVGLQNISGPASITDSIFSHNAAQESSAGALYYVGDSTSDLTISGSEFNNNYATAGGAMSVSTVHTLDIGTTEFRENSTTDQGGAVSVLSANSVSIDHGEFVGNYSDGSSGGAVQLGAIPSGYSIENSYFSSNTAVGNGGAVFTATPGASSQISTTTFVDNHSVGGFGGALFLQSGGAQTMYVDTNTFQDNSSYLGGGALAVGNTTADFFVVRSTFAGNYAEGSATPGQSIYVGNVGGNLGIASSTIDEFGESFSAFAIEIAGMGGASAQLSVSNATILGSGGIHVAARSAGTAYVRNSIVGSKVAAHPALELTSNIAGGIFFVLESSLSSSPTTSYISADSGSSMSVADFGLEVLANNGGATKTRLPKAGSPALGAANVGSRSTYDQRGAPFDGVVGGVADIGAVTTQANWFADVTDTASSFYPYMQWMYESGSSTGTPQPSGKPLYNPANAVSRQAMASFLYRLSGETFSAPAEQTFADVAPSATFYTAIEWMAAKGISTGTPQPSGKPLYKPADPVSRQAMALFLARYDGAILTTPTTQSFADVPISATTAGAIEWMKNQGISTGTPQPSGLPLYKPADPVSRQAMAAFLYRLEHRV